MDTYNLRVIKLENNEVYEKACALAVNFGLYNCRMMRLKS